jgi:hypothetical protein
MIAAFVALVLLGQTPPEAAWTWTLYEDAPLVLANEVPDTPNLRTTLECDAGSSVAVMTLYGEGSASGMARISAGAATAVSEAQAGRAGSVKLTLRTDHPTFAAFAADGRLGIAMGEQRRAVEIQPAHLAKLRRFAELCSA